MIDHPAQRVLKYLLQALTDPITGGLSGTRVGGLVCLVAGNLIAFLHPHESATVAALIVGGAVAFLTRTKSDAP